MRDGGSKLAHDRPESEGDRPSAQVLQFRPRQRMTDRSIADAPATNGPDGDLLDDLAQYERDREEDETINYPRRMLMNAIAVGVVTVLIGIGVWLADTITEMERDQDCILQGRQNCAAVEVAAPVRN